jgi:hypothetical protein
MWVELFVGSLPCHEGLSSGTPGFLPPKNQHLYFKIYISIRSQELDL